MKEEHPEVAVVALLIGAAHGFVRIDTTLARELERQLALPVCILDEARPPAGSAFFGPMV